MSADTSYEPQLIYYANYGFKGHFEYARESTPDINPGTGAGTFHGLSSFKVVRGTWSLYLETNYGGAPIELDGKTQFGPGEYDLKVLGKQYNDKVQSMKLIPKITLYYHWGSEVGQTDLTESNPDINSIYPDGDIKGLSTFVVHSKKWSLFTETNYQGDKVNINGVTEFGPGKYEIHDDFNDTTSSVKLLET